MIKIIRVGKSYIKSITKHPDFDVLFIGFGNGEMIMVNYKTSKFVAKIKEHKHDLNVLISGNIV